MLALPAPKSPSLLSPLAFGLLLATPSSTYEVDLQLTKGGLLI
jgi:hypothetical protein